jgi:EAL and modified HD-GYP domain-containing signal transduction protein
MQDVFIGRQPIYARGLDVFAYELLFRGGDVDYADFSEGDRATSQVILNAFSEIGLERVVGERTAFLNLTRGFVTGEYPLPVPHDRVVLEILEDVHADAEVLEGLRDLKRRGYQIALDDFVATDLNRELLPLADIVKIDVLGLEVDEIREQVAQLAQYDVWLLAEKIETQEQFQACRDMGFDYFQGFFLSRPNVIRDRVLPPNRVNLLYILSELHEPGCDLERINELVSHDVALSYRLLRHVNTVRFGLRHHVESIREALVYLGIDKVRSLASLYLMASIEDKPHDLIMTSMLRAKMCAGLAALDHELDEHTAFTVGLFSTLDAMMDCAMDVVLDRLPLTPEISAALLRREGKLGEILSSTLAYERGDWERVPCLSLSRGPIKAAFLDAVAFVEQVDRSLAKRAA